jgi:hypothetical protein
MDLSPIKKIFQKFASLRDYSSLIIPGVLAILAALLFIPTTLMQHSLDSKMDKESLSKAKTLDSLGRDTPSGRQWQVLLDRQNSIQNDANKIVQLAEQSSRRELISYDVFPAPKETSPRLFGQFGQKYRAAIDAWALNLKARSCPTQAELSKSLNRSFTTVGSNSDSGLQETDKIIIDHVCREVAQSVKVYFDPANIPGYKTWENYEYSDQVKAVEDCWYWQIAYWVIEDCFQTVKTLDAGSANVLDAPVKRIVDIGFAAAPSSAQGSTAMTQSASAKAEKPGYITSLRAGLTLPLTARVSNDRLDIVHFRLSVIVSAKAVPLFLQQLCTGKEHKFRGFNNDLPEKTFYHNQITILKCDFDAINPEDNDNKLYRFGSDGVVKLDLFCGYIFDKNGYDDVKPPSVKNDLESRLAKANQ